MGLQKKMAAGDTTEFDGFLMNIAERQRGIDPMLDVVFGFLRRRTDFFKGATSDTARKTVMDSFEKHLSLAEQAAAKEKKEAEKKKKKAAEKPKEKAAPKQNAPKVVADPNK